MNALNGKLDTKSKVTKVPSEFDDSGTADRAVEGASAHGGARRRGLRRVLMFAVPLILAGAGAYAWVSGGRYIETDNAYVHQPIVPISPDVAGRIVSVSAVENERVGEGSTLFQIDRAPFQIALDRADADLAAARQQVDQLRASYRTAQARLEAAQTILDIQQREYDRKKSLVDSGVASSSSLDDATMALRNAQNDVIVSKETLASALSALGGNPEVETDQVPAVRAALAARAAAARNLEITTIAAPVDGVVSQIGNLNVGQYVSPGSTVLSLVQADQTWIEANFKETQLSDLRPGEPVSVTVDAYPGLSLRGKVQSIGSATGSQFSLIPAQNATGNWVKVVQRVPVRIDVSADPDHPLRDGMSVRVSVDTGRSWIDALR